MEKHRVESLIVSCYSSLCFSFVDESWRHARFRRRCRMALPPPLPPPLPPSLPLLSACITFQGGKVDGVEEEEEEQGEGGEEEQQQQQPKRRRVCAMLCSGFKQR